MSMKIVISPAKSLDYESDFPEVTPTQPAFVAEAEKLNSALKKKSPAQLQKLMGISDQLAQLNWTRNQEFSRPFTAENARPAVFAFNGDVYTGLEAGSIAPEHHNAMQERLRILSGLYGMLRPFDLMQPYRLEMGTSFGVNGSKNLYAFWKDKLTKALNEELEEEDFLVNLASNEYFKAIDKKALNAPVITPVFKDWKNDKLKVISFFAKKARGAMVRFLIANNVDSPEGIKGFSWEGYQYSEEFTKKADEPVFVR